MYSYENCVKMTWINWFGKYWGSNPIAITSCVARLILFFQKIFISEFMFYDSRLRNLIIIIIKLPVPFSVLFQRKLSVYCARKCVIPHHFFIKQLSSPKEQVNQSKFKSHTQLNFLSHQSSLRLSKMMPNYTPSTSVRRVIKQSRRRIIKICWSPINL